MPKPAPYVVAVSAGRYDRTVTAVMLRLRDAVEDQGAAVYLSTEVMRDQRPAFDVLRDRFRAVFRGEYAIAYDRDRFAPDGLRARLATLSAALFPRGGPHNLVPVKALEHRLRDKLTGQRVTFTIGHLPAHLDAGGHYSPLAVDHDRVKAHRQALARLGKRARRRADAHPDRAQFVGLDSNVNLYRPEWRARLAYQLFPLVGVWTGGVDGRLPAHGDLGSRLVVGAWTYGLERSGKVLPSDPGSDHDLVLVEVRP